MELIPAQPVKRDSAARRRGAAGLSHRAAVIAAAVLACVIVAGLAVHYRTGRRRRPRPKGAVWEGPGPATMPAPTSGPLELASRPLAGVGMEPLEKPPPDMVAPPGARTSYAFRKFYPDGLRDNLACTADGDVNAAESFYRTNLAAAGYKLLKRAATMRGNGVALVFGRGTKELYSVSLRPTDKGKKVRISLVVFRPGACMPK